MNENNLDNLIKYKNLDIKKIGYIPSIFTICPLPYQNPKLNILKKSIGAHTLTLSTLPEFSIPSGKYGRLILSLITTKAIKQQHEENPQLIYFESVTEILKELVNYSDGRNIKLFKQQFYNVASLRLDYKYDYENDDYKGIKYFSFLISEEMQLFNIKMDTIKTNKIIQTMLFKNYIHLTNKFYEYILEHAVPVDLITYSMLSARQKDIYIWLVKRLPELKKPLQLNWSLILNQFGSDNGLTRANRSEAKKDIIYALKLIRNFYDKAKYKIDDKGLILYPSQPHIPKLENQGYSIY